MQMKTSVFLSRLVPQELKATQLPHSVGDIPIDFPATPSSSCSLLLPDVRNVFAFPEPGGFSRTPSFPLHVPAKVRLPLWTLSPFLQSSRCRQFRFYEGLPFSSTPSYFSQFWIVIVSLGSCLHSFNPP